MLLHQSCDPVDACRDTIGQPHPARHIVGLAFKLCVVIDLRCVINVKLKCIGMLAGNPQQRSVPFGYARNRSSRPGSRDRVPSLLARRPEMPARTRCAVHEPVGSGPYDSLPTSQYFTWYGADVRSWHAAVPSAYRPNRCDTLPNQKQAAPAQAPSSYTKRRTDGESRSADHRDQPVQADPSESCP